MLMNRCRLLARFAFVLKLVKHIIIIALNNINVPIYASLLSMAIYYSQRGSGSVHLLENACGIMRTHSAPTSVGVYMYI